MPNMSYCRFENTYRDLMDCETALSDGGKLSKQESEYAFRLVKLCRMITEQFEDMNDEEIRESLKGD